uniref:Uncharacterized protein n=1 Tax=Sus scrofa TaxID=9823 RepID=A0A8D1APF6_PIG
MRYHLTPIKIMIKNQENFSLPSLTIQSNNIKYKILPASIPINNIFVSAEPRWKCKKRKSVTHRKRGRGRGRGVRRGRGGGGGRS